MSMEHIRLKSPLEPFDIPTSPVNDLIVPIIDDGELRTMAVITDKTSIRIAGIESESIVDGPGMRYTIFTQGCKHHCPGCHNPHTHDLDGGYFKSMFEIKDEILSNPLLAGVTISGGDPIEQCDGMLLLTTYLKNMAPQVKSIMMYTGYTYEELVNIEDDHKRDVIRLLLKNLEVLVDGRYDEKLKSMDTKFRGSSNQRYIMLENGVPKNLDMNGYSFTYAKSIKFTSVGCNLLSVLSKMFITELSKKFDCMSVSDGIPLMFHYISDKYYELIKSEHLKISYNQQENTLHTHFANPEEVLKQVRLKNAPISSK